VGNLNYVQTSRQEWEGGCSSRWGEFVDWPRDPAHVARDVEGMTRLMINTRGT